MQKIFHNAKVITGNDSAEIAEAFFVNDGSFVLVSSNKEVLEMKTDEMEVIDLQGKTVIPTFVNPNSRIFETIDNEIKNAKFDKKSSKIKDLSEDFEKFSNFSEYQKKFLKIQNELIKAGIMTIVEQNLSRDGFVFWKKVSEGGNLKIDVIANVDFVTAKAVMDNNCRSYRKYKDHFRLGGYSVILDGNVLEKGAYLEKAYKHEKGYTGFPTMYDEQLAFLLKTAMEEKKQLVVFAGGDAATHEYLRCFAEYLEKHKPDDKFKPILFGNLLSSKKEFDSLLSGEVAAGFDISKIKSHSKEIKNVLGRIRHSSSLNTRLAVDKNLDVLVSNDSNIVPNFFEVMKFLVYRETDDGLVEKKKQITLEKALECVTKTASKLYFDGEQKGSLESGKNASFLVLSDDLTADNLSKISVEKVYIMGEEVELSSPKTKKKD